jgi:ADP-heptose:LPS heptosyltransferase
LDKEDKCITFYHDWEDKGYIPTGTGDIRKYKKEELKIFKIVQVGISSNYLGETDLDLNEKTSFYDLSRLLNIRRFILTSTTAIYVHIAEALNIKSVILFGSY